MNRMQRNVNRRATVLAAFSAAATLAASTQLASAQTWVNPTIGNWSVGANWVGGVAPASAAATALQFNATGAQTYTATNDVANPFTLLSITFNNTGTGQINIAGSPLSFSNTAITVNGSGAQSISNAIEIQHLGDQNPLDIGGPGTGALNLTGALSSNPAATTTAGGYVLQNNPGATNISGGGTLYGLAVQQGTMNVTAGTYTLTSTERGVDTVGAINDGGLNGISVGRNAGQTANFVLSTGATIGAQNMMVGDVVGSIGVGTINGTITMPMAGTGLGIFGINNSGTLAVTGGGKITGQLFELSRQIGANTRVIIDGAGSRVDAIQSSARNGTSNTTISNDGVLNVGTASGNGNVFFASAANANATALITSGGRITQGNQLTAASGTDTVANVTINNGGQWNSTGGSAFFGGGQGANVTINVDSATSQISLLNSFSVGGGTNSFARMNLTNGAKAVGTGATGNAFFGSGQDSNATLTLSGASEFRNGNQQTVATNFGATGTVLISGASKMENITGNSFVASSTVTGSGDPIPSTAFVTVTGAGSQYNTIRTGTTGGQQNWGSSGDATLSILNGGAVSGFRPIIGGVLGAGTIIIDGANSRYTSGGTTSINASAFEPAENSGLFVRNNGTFSTGIAFIGSNANSKSILDVNGGTVTVGTLALMGGGSGDNATAAINLSGGGRYQAERFTVGQNNLNSVVVTATGANTRMTTVGIGAGTGSWAMGGGLNSVQTITFGNGAVAETAGALFLAGGVGTDGGRTTFNVDNLGTATAGFIQMGQNAGGRGTFNINAGGVANVATNTIVGLNPTAFGTLAVNGAGATLNTPNVTVAFANFVVGTGDPIPGGNGFVNVTNGGQINTTGTGMNVADSEGGVGVLNVTGPNSKIMGTGTAQLIVGNQGAATMTITNGGLVNMTGNPGNAFFSAGTFGTSNTSIVGGTLIVGGQLQLGGSGGDAGTSAVMSISGNGAASSGGQTSVYSTATLNIGSGTSKGIYTSGGDTAVDGVINFNAGTFTTTGTLEVGGSVILSSAGRAPNGTASNKKMVEVGQATLTSSGVIDLNDNDMLLHNDTVVHVQSLVAAARNGGLWNQPGITSTAAKNAVPQNKNLGVVSGANFLTAGTPTFNGKTVVAGDTLVKFTFNGDTDLNGTVDFDDYSRVDNGFNNNRTGWFNGDFDYNGVVDFDDYSLIDQAFNTQGIVVLNASGGDLAGPGARTLVSVIGAGLANIVDGPGAMANTNEVMQDTAGELAVGPVGELGGAGLRAVPEPSVLGTTLTVLCAASLRRRRRAAASLTRPAGCTGGF